MKKNKAIELSVLLFAFLLSAIPLATKAAIVPCATSEHPEPCTLCHFIVGIKNIIDWGMGILTFVAIGAIVLGGIFYVISAGNQEMMTKAKNIIIQTLTGFAIVLGAWLIVTYSMYVIGASNKEGIMRTNGAWYDFTCDTVSNQSATPTFTFSTPTSTTTTTTTTGTTVASAAVDSSGVCLNASDPGTQICAGFACKTCNLDSYLTAINTAATQFAIDVNFVKGIICRESSGNTNAQKNESDGTMSCGLMQINVTTQTECDYWKTHPAENIQKGTELLGGKIAQAKTKMSAQDYTTVTIEEMAAAAYNCCANGEDPNSPSNDCTSATGWNSIPKWACPIEPGVGDFNMCAVKDYACSVAACS
ncbi:MAG: transglycosylase SLT domain-containing protein [Candidatus Moranbacteria bacterium]|jgi:hypothetical protein|nr:transglycosylase SLT domain-containing protein [Candidatus Moranbacteria bacterium]